MIHVNNQSIWIDDPTVYPTDVTLMLYTCLAGSLVVRRALLGAPMSTQESRVHDDRLRLGVLFLS